MEHVIAKDKIKLPNGLTMICYEKEETGESTGTKRKFSVMQVMDNKEELVYLTKLLEVNGQAVKRNWRW